MQNASAAGRGCSAADGIRKIRKRPVDVQPISKALAAGELPPLIFRTYAAVNSSAVRKWTSSSTSARGSARRSGLCVPYPPRRSASGCQGLHWAFAEPGAMDFALMNPARSCLECGSRSTSLMPIPGGRELRLDPGLDQTTMPLTSKRCGNAGKHEPEPNRMVQGERLWCPHEDPAPADVQGVGGQELLRRPVPHLNISLDPRLLASLLHPRGLPRNPGRLAGMRP